MINPLPMRFRAPFADEALPGYLSECAERYSAHPSALLELACCPISLRRAAFLAQPEAERLALLLGQPPADLAAAAYANEPRAGGIPRVSFNGARVRRAHLVAKKRRLSPAAMRESNHIRAISLVEPITFCVDTWTMLVDRCLSSGCRRPLTWQKIDHVSHCPACGADQRDFETLRVAEDLQPHLRLWVDLIHSLPERRSAARAHLPDKLQTLDSGTVFDLVLGLGSVMGAADDGGPGLSLAAIAGAMEIATQWPRSILDALEADAQLNDARVQSLSTRLRRYAQSSATLPEVRSLLMDDLARERACPLGAKAEIAAARRKLRGLGVREAAAHIGVAPAYITKLRRAGILEAKAIVRGRTRLELVTYESCEAVRMALEDRMSETEFAQLTGLSEHVIEQLAEAGHVEWLQAPAIDILFARPVLKRSSAERFIDQLRSRVFPLGNDDDDWIPLAKAFNAVGGRPKPYGSLISWLFEKGATLRAPVDAKGAADLRALHISPLVLDQLGAFDSEFPVADAKPISTATAAEILNCGADSVQLLLERKLLERSAGPGEASLAAQSVVRAARQLISFAEINARLGFQDRSASIWLRRHGIASSLQGFAQRKAVEDRLREELPLGILRRHALGLTIAAVRRGAADLTDREWDLVRAWVPRQRRSRRGVCDRSVLNAAIWISATGQSWRDIPSRYGDPDASYSRYHHWKRTGTMQIISNVLKRERQRPVAKPARMSNPLNGAAA